MTSLLAMLRENRVFASASAVGRKYAILSGLLRQSKPAACLSDGLPGLGFLYENSPFWYRNRHAEWPKSVWRVDTVSVDSRQKPRGVLADMPRKRGSGGIRRPATLYFAIFFVWIVSKQAAYSPPSSWEGLGEGAGHSLSPLLTASSQGLMVFVSSD